MRAESKGSWLFMKGPLGPVPKELWPKARQYWEDLFQDKGIESPGRKSKNTTTNDEVKVSLDSKSKEPITTDELRKRFENLESQRSSAASSSYGPIRNPEANRFAPEALKTHDPTRNIFTQDDSLESTSRPLAPSDEEEWQDLSPSHRPKVKPPASRPKLEIPAKESAKVVELGTTGGTHTAEQDGTKHVPQSTQQAPDRVRVRPPIEEEQRVVSKEDTSSEMVAMASGPRPVEAQASSAVNRRGVPSLSPVTPRRHERRIWAA